MSKFNFFKRKREKSQQSTMEITHNYSAIIIDDKEFEALAEYAKAGDLQTLQDKNTYATNIAFLQNSKGRTLLEVAVEAGKPKLVDWLLEQANNVKTSTTSQKTLLHSDAHLSRYEGYESSMASLAKRMDVNAKDNFGNTPLWCALRVGNYKKAEELLSYGADVNALDSSGDTLLHKALYTMPNMQAGITEFLLKHGADYTLRDRDGMTPLEAARDCGKEAVIGLLKGVEKHHGRLKDNVKGSEHLAMSLTDITAWTIKGNMHESMKEAAKNGRETLKQELSKKKPGETPKATKKRARKELKQYVPVKEHTTMLEKEYTSGSAPLNKRVRQSEDPNVLGEKRQRKQHSKMFVEQVEKERAQKSEEVTQGI